MKRPLSLIQFTANGGRPDEFHQFPVGHVEGLRDGPLLYPIRSGGRVHLMAGPAGGDPHPFLQTSEESNRPLAIARAGTLAFKLGTAPRQQIAIATLRDGRIVNRLSLNAAEVRSMALSADGSTLYYAAGGFIWSVNVNAPLSAPRKIIDGDDIALDAGRRILYV